MRVLIELRADAFDASELAVDLRNLGARAHAARRELEFQVDRDFGVVSMVTPARRAAVETRELAGWPEEVHGGSSSRLLGSISDFLTFPGQRRARTLTLVRGEIPDDQAVEAAERMPEADSRIRQIFADPEVVSCSLCRDDVVGTSADVETALSATALAREGLTGAGVRVAIVDGGINLNHLRKQGHAHAVDAVASIRFPDMPAPGEQLPGHGTMCAYQIGTAAPAATLVDVPILRGTGDLTTLLSDAIRAYSELRVKLGNGVIDGPLVVSNSWAIYDPSTDFPPGHESNYSHSPDHPFNLAVEALVDAGADVVFAAGNCGPACAYPKCRFARHEPSILGANSHPDVLSVGAVGVDGQAIGYSPIGGALQVAKPDVLAFSQFQGSGVEDIDAGTSTAGPVAAGVVAAIRTLHPATEIPPRDLRDLVRHTAIGIATSPDWAPGTIDTLALLKAL
jgi:subtilisin family serine protease